AGGVLQPGDVVEVVVVELRVDRLEGRLDVGEIHDPAAVVARFAADAQLDAERVPVQARALVALGHVGEAVRGFDGEDLEDVHGANSTRAPYAGTRTAPSISTRALRL